MFSLLQNLLFAQIWAECSLLKVVAKS